MLLDLEIVDFSNSPYKNIYNNLINFQILNLLKESKDINNEFSINDIKNSKKTKVLGALCELTSKKHHH